MPKQLPAPPPDRQPCEPTSFGAALGLHGTSAAASVYVLFLVLTVAGCASSPPPPTLTPDVPAQFEAASTLPDPAAPTVDLRGWWRAFGDPGIDAAVDQALADNLGLAAAAARLRAARAMAGASDAASRPQLAIGTTPQSSPDGRNSYFQAGFDASWELDLFGRGDALRAAAAADTASAEAMVQAARVSLVAEVVRTCLELRHAEREIALLTRAGEAARERDRLLTVRVANRLASADDAAAGRIAMAQATAAIAEPRIDALRARQRLRVLLGNAQAQLPRMDPSRSAGNSSAPHLGMSPTPADMVRARPDIRIAEQQVAKAAAAVGIAHADLYPRFSLIGMLGIATRVGGAAGGETHGLISAGPWLRLPLFDGGQRQSVIAARDAELDAAVASYREAVLEGLAEAETALGSLALLQDRIDATQRADAAEAEREAGVATRVDLRLADGLMLADAHAARIQAQHALLQSQLAQQLAFVAFFKSVGGAPLPAEGGPK